MSIKPKVLELVSLFENGRFVEALETFYDEGVAMQENLSNPTVGRNANIARERAFFGGITIHESRAWYVVVDGDRAVINWLFDYTAGDGKRYRIDQLAVQEWRNGKIVNERFVYDTATIAERN